MTIDRKCLINWVGGKRLLRKTIEKLIPKDIGSYIEPFGGGGWVLFYKDKWADLEVYNDLDGRLVNLFRIVKYHPNAFIEEWSNLLGSREMFLQFLNGTPITDILKLIAKGYNNKQIARKMGESLSSIKMQKWRLYCYLGIHSAIDAVYMGLQMHLLRMEDVCEPMREDIYESENEKQMYRSAKNNGSDNRNVQTYAEIISFPAKRTRTA